MEKASFVRIFILVLLSGIITYFIYFQKIQIKPVVARNNTQTVFDLDSLLNTVLDKYNITKKDIKKREYRFENIDFVRREFLIPIPKDTFILNIHLDLKNELSKYNLKISGAENTKNKSTTLFIEKNKKIIANIVLKTKI